MRKLVVTEDTHAPPILLRRIVSQVIGSGSPTVGRQATNPQFQNPTSFEPKLNYSIAD